MSTSPLSIDVYVSPMRPYHFPDQLGEGEVATWAPSSSTLHGERDQPHTLWISARAEVARRVNDLDRAARPRPDPLTLR